MMRGEAVRLLNEWVSDTSLIQHSLQVEAVMRAAALRFGNGAADQDAWGIAGLLHDADWERWPEEHPSRIVKWLEDRGEPLLAHAISAHGTTWGVPYNTQLSRALVACDELTGFVSACAKVRPTGLIGLDASSVKKKLKSPSFAARIDRREIIDGTSILGVEFDDHIEFVISALRTISINNLDYSNK